MSTAAEQEFRHVERQLDELVGAATEQLRADEVQIEDRSARTYHYKNQYLFWDHYFLKEWRVEAERARVTVNLTYGEPMVLGATPEVKISWRAEIFRQGHESRIDARSEQRVLLSHLRERGIASLVTGALDEGSLRLPSAL